MFLKFSFKNLPTFVLVTCAILSPCNSSLAQTSVTLGQIRDLPAINAQTRQETGTTNQENASRLFTIKDKKPIPPVSRFSNARIVAGENVAPPAAQSQTNWSPPASAADVARPITEVTVPRLIAADNASPTNEQFKLKTGFYTISFANPYQSPQPDEDEPQQEPDSPSLDGLETGDPSMDDVDEDLKASDDELDLSEDELDGENLDDELAEDLEYDDAPIARPEFGPWPSKSIQQVRLDLVEHGAAAPEDRSSRLFASSQRLDGNIAATEKVFAWAAPNINYQPLYFEDVALERYGQTKGLVKQPFVSAGRFLADKVLLGTRALRVSPKSCDSPLGYCRPGSPSTVSSGGGCGCKCLSCPQEDCQVCH